MKTLTYILAFLTAMSFSGNAQTFSEAIRKELTFEKKSTDNAIIIATIGGSIKVIGYNGDKVILEAERIVYGKTNERLEKGKQQVQLGLIDNADTLIFYTKDGCNSFGRNPGNRKSWGYNVSCGRNECHEEYEFKINYTLKVPAGTNVELSTINDGDITIENIRGKIKANNINGHIKMTNLIQAAEASTINGDVDVEYAQNPSTDCRFYTLNGNINANFQKGLGAKLSFDSFNGSFYTNIDQIVALPSVIEKGNNSKGMKYKIKGTNYQVGKGGALLDFETFNGNVYLKEKTN